jgi:hypothetical protein
VGVQDLRVSDSNMDATRNHASGLTLGWKCFYNKGYSTLKIEWHGVVATLEDLA